MKRTLGTNYSEIKIQATGCQFIWNKYPETRYCLYHVANEAQRSPVEWGMLKAAGFINGIQDLHFDWSGKSYRIEMKTETGVISDDQKVVHAAHMSQGFKTYVFRTAENLITFIGDIVKGYDLIYWDQFISPYCKPEMLQTYINQRNAKKQSNKQ